MPVTVCAPAHTWVNLPLAACSVGHETRNSVVRSIATSTQSAVCDRAESSRATSRLPALRDVPEESCSGTSSSP